MQNIKYVPLGFQQIGAEALASAQSLTVPTGATVAVLRVDAASVRWRDDGSAPTASVGITMADTDAPLEYWGTLSAIQFIAVGGSPVLNISYYRIAG